MKKCYPKLVLKTLFQNPASKVARLQVNATTGKILEKNRFSNIEFQSQGFSCISSACCVSVCCILIVCLMSALNTEKFHLNIISVKQDKPLNIIVCYVWYYSNLGQFSLCPTHYHLTEAATERCSTSHSTFFQHASDHNT